MANTAVKKIERNNQPEVEQQESKIETSPSKSDIEKIIQRKMFGIGFLRGNRIALSKRLHSYSNKWQFIMFFMNVEAVIIVLLSLTNTIETIHVGQFDMSFDLFSGVFTLYVILLQYYVSTLNYKERTLRVHYHELELEDIIQELQMLSLNMHLKEVNMSEKTIIEKYYKLVDQYQLAVKNNENHREIDFARTKYDSNLRKYEKGETDEKPKHPMDFTLDMALIYANTLLPVVVFFVICYAFIF